MAVAVQKDQKELLKQTENEQELLMRIQDELRKPLEDPIKESTVEYYLQNKDKVGFLLIQVLSFYTEQACCLYSYHHLIGPPTILIKKLENIT